MAETLDLLDIGDEGLYFDEPSSAEVDALILRAAGLYGEAEADQCLLRAYFLAPEQLSVLVALYRYFFYQHRLQDALRVAERALAVTARRLRLPAGWEALSTASVDDVVLASMGLLRFLLLALKGSAVILLRLGELDEADRRLRKIRELDHADVLGVEPLLAILSERQTTLSTAQPH